MPRYPEFAETVAVAPFRSEAFAEDLLDVAEEEALDRHVERLTLGFTLALVLTACAGWFWR